MQQWCPLHHRPALDTLRTASWPLAPSSHIPPDAFAPLLHSITAAQHHPGSTPPHPFPPPHAQAFEIVARPALDSFESALDRTKMAIYSRFAEWGLPCPITQQPGSIGAQARSLGGGAAQGEGRTMQQ